MIFSLAVLAIVRVLKLFTVKGTSKSNTKNNVYTLYDTINYE